MMTVKMRDSLAGTPFELSDEQWERLWDEILPTLPRSMTCRYCGGTGKQAGNDCMACGGSGQA